MDEITMQEKLIDELRLKSIATGQIYDLQLLNLKCIPLVIFGEQLLNEFTIDCEKCTIHFELTGKADYPEDEQKARLGFLVQSVQKILGQYAVTVLLNKKALDGRRKSTNIKTKSRTKPNASGKKRVPKTRKR